MPIPTPLHPRTSALCTSHRWKEWAGYVAVCSYDTHHDREYMAFRHAAGMLDVSPLYKYEVTGADAAAFLARVLARDVTRLKVGRVAYCCWCDGRGKLLDDGTVTRLDEGRYRLTSADPSGHWLERCRRGFDVVIEDVSRGTAAVAVQGPRARDVVAEACADGAGVAGLGFFRALSTKLDGRPVDVTRTGYTGDLGYEVWVKADDAIAVWDALMAVGRNHGLEPAGLDALDVTRIEAGFILNGVDYFSARSCLIGAQMSSPFEMGLGWTVHLDRDPFIGQEALRKERAKGSEWALAGLEVSWEELERLCDSYGLPPVLPTHAWRDGRPIYSGGRQIGRATSGAWSPLLKKYIVLASLPAALSAEGTRVKIEHTVEYARHRLTATVVKRPFFDPERKTS